MLRTNQTEPVIELIVDNKEHLLSVTEGDRFDTGSQGRYASMGTV